MWVWGWAPETDAQDKRLISVGFQVKGGKGVAPHVFSFVYLEKEGQHLFDFQTLCVANSRKIKGSDGPCPRDSAGWPSFPLHFGLDVHKKSYFSTRFLFPSCFLLPRQVVWTSIFLAEGSFIYSLVHCIFNTVFYSTNCQVLFNFLPGLELAPEDREMKNTQPWP